MAPSADRFEASSDRLAPLGLDRCPRCGYRGDGISYFSKPGNIGLLLGLSFISSGVIGLVYWLARRKHRICPSCGLAWDYAVRSNAEEYRSRFSSPPEKLPSTGGVRRFFGSALVLLASFLMILGILEAGVGAFIGGSIVGAIGSGTFLWGWRSLTQRREAIAAGMQREVLRLAEVRGGRLTVTEVAASMNLSLPAAEKILVAMDDDFRVRSDITDDGVIVYEFPEVVHRKQLGGGPSAPG